MSARSNATSAGAPAADVAYLECAALTDLFRRRELSPVEVARAMLARIEQLDPIVNAVVHVRAERTLQMAAASEARYRSTAPLSALDGVPMTVKDLSAVVGWPMQRGSLALDAAAPVLQDTACVARLREAGAVFLGKTATPDAGGRPVTRSAVHGVTANPYSLAHTPGGSSGGAAASLAMGFGPVAVASDGAGSIRIPSSFTNVFGLKPGFGRVPAFPTDIDMPHSVNGPMSRTVQDAALMLEIMSRPDARDPYAWPTPFVVPADLEDPDLSGVSIAYSRRLGFAPFLVDEEVDGLVASAAALLEDANAVVTEDDPVWPVDPFAAFETFLQSGRAFSLGRFSLDQQQRLDSLFVRLALKGKRLLATDVYRAIADRMAIAAASQDFFGRYDLLIGPVMPVPAFAIELDAPPSASAEDLRWCPYTYPWNMTGQPAASAPIGFTEAGLPVGVQLIGRVGEESQVLRAAAAIQRRTALHLRRPPCVVAIAALG